MTANVSVTFPALSGYTDQCTGSALGYTHSKFASASYPEYSGYDQCVIDGIEVGTNTIIKEVITELELLGTQRVVRYRATFNKTSGLVVSTHFSQITTTTGAVKVMGASAYTTEATFSSMGYSIQAGALPTWHDLYVEDSTDVIKLDDITVPITESDISTYGYNSSSNYYKTTSWLCADDTIIGNNVATIPKYLINGLRGIVFKGCQLNANALESAVPVTS